MEARADARSGVDLRQSLEHAVEPLSVPGAAKVDPSRRAQSSSQLRRGSCFRSATLSARPCSAAALFLELGSRRSDLDSLAPFAARTAALLWSQRTDLSTLRSRMPTHGRRSNGAEPILAASLGSKGGQAARDPRCRASISSASRTSELRRRRPCRQKRAQRRIVSRSTSPAGCRKPRSVRCDSKVSGPMSTRCDRGNRASTVEHSPLFPRPQLASACRSHHSPLLSHRQAALNELCESTCEPVRQVKRSSASDLLKLSAQTASPRLRSCAVCIGSRSSRFARRLAKQASTAQRCDVRVPASACTCARLEPGEIRTKHGKSLEGVRPRILCAGSRLANRRASPVRCSYERCCGDLASRRACDKLAAAPRLARPRSDLAERGSSFGTCRAGLCD